MERASPSTELNTTAETSNHFARYVIDPNFIPASRFRAVLEIRTLEQPVMSGSLQAIRGTASSRRGSETRHSFWLDAHIAVVHRSALGLDANVA